MARPKKGATLESRAKDALVGDGDHWISTLHWHRKETFVLRSGEKYFSQLLVLWTIQFGDPVGQLSNACGRSECVNPYHYRDQSDREQLAWRTDVQNVDIIAELGRAGISEDDVVTMFLRIIDINGLAPSDILDAYGMTNDFGCYSCGNRFDPLIEDEYGLKHLTPGNGVICPACWTDEDQKKSEESDAD